jgi:hypothetical protein
MTEFFEPVTGDVDIQDPTVGTCFGTECKDLQQSVVEPWSMDSDNEDGAAAVEGRVIEDCVFLNYCSARKVTTGELSLESMIANAGRIADDRRRKNA